jgi:hypothetical protein
MKIVNVSMIAVALLTAGATTAFARGGVHTGVPAESAMNSYVAAQSAASNPTITSGVVVRQYPALDQQSAAVLRLDEIGDANSSK